MTIDDESSVFVGNLRYGVTGDSLRRVFSLYGAVLAVKIHNDRGNCYGFVTFVNPRSAVNAIREMDGQEIYGRAVRVGFVRSKGRPNFYRDLDKGFETGARKSPRRDFSYNQQQSTDVLKKRFEDYERGSERGHYRRYVGDNGHRGDVVERGHFRKHEGNRERASSYNSMELRNNDHQKSLDRNNHHQMNDLQDVDGAQLKNGHNGDVEHGRVTKRGRDRDQQSRSTRAETSNSSRRKSVDKNSHHHMKDNRPVDEDQVDNGAKGDVEPGRVRKRESDREQVSRSTSVETSNSSRQKSVAQNSHRQMKDNLSVDGDQFDNGPKGDVEPGCARKRERDWKSGSSFSSEESRYNSRQKTVDRDNQQLNRSPLSDDRSRRPSVESLNDDQDQIKTKLAVSDQKIVKLRAEISRMEDDVADKEEEVSQLQEKYQKLDNSSKAITKLTSDRHIQLEKLLKCYLHVKDCEKKLKQAEEELQLLVDATRTELEMEGVQVT